MLQQQDELRKLSFIVSLSDLYQYFGEINRAPNKYKKCVAGALRLYGVHQRDAQSIWNTSGSMAVS